MREIFSAQRLAELAQARREIKAAERDWALMEALERNMTRRKRMGEAQKRDTILRKEA